MARELFIPWKPHAATLTVVEQANIIIDEYFGLGFNLTLRQLFYQFVARAALENIFREYKRLGTIVRNARDAGLIDWDAIEDRTREVRTHSFWTNPAGIISSAAESYREDLWAGQRYRPEVWIEKDALIGVIEGVCIELRVPYFAHRGNNSQTLQYQAGKRFARYLDLGLIPLILHLADHDPNGIDMTRDNEERLKLYTRAEIEIRRIALNLDQVRRYNPPPSFVKESDTRTSGYRDRFGTDECWELDALSPTVIADLIRTEIEGLIDRPVGGMRSPARSAAASSSPTRLRIGPRSRKCWSATDDARPTLKPNGRDAVRHRARQAARARRDLCRARRPGYDAHRARGGTLRDAAPVATTRGRRSLRNGQATGARAMSITKLHARFARIEQAYMAALAGREADELERSR